MSHAGFGQRLNAFLIDIIPIMLLTAAVFYLFLGFDRTWQVYRADPGNDQARVTFLAERNLIRDSSFLIWIVYAAVMEASAIQGTFGKRAMRIRVVDRDGNRLTLAQSIWRNVAKIASYVPLSLGFLWVALSKQKRGWHDIMAKTDVVQNAVE